jgi:hypothetical protein
MQSVADTMTVASRKQADLILENGGGLLNSTESILVEMQGHWQRRVSIHKIGVRRDDRLAVGIDGMIRATANAATGDLDA